MFNIMLDRLPSSYEGYLIRTSFRIGMQICLCLQDEDLSGQEKFIIASNLLFGKGVPEDPEIVNDAIGWFLSCGDDGKSSSDGKTLFYWDFDSSRIYSSFKQTYGIDLAKEDLHWFEFIYLMGSLNKDSAFANAVEIRRSDLSSFSGKSKQEMIKLKNDLTPQTKLSQEEQERIDAFNALFDGGAVNG